MDDLDEAIDRFLEQVVEAVDEYEGLALWHQFGSAADPGHRLRAIKRVRLHRHEAGRRIAR